MELAKFYYCLIPVAVCCSGYVLMVLSDRESSFVSVLSDSLKLLKVLIFFFLSSSLNLCVAYCRSTLQNIALKMFYGFYVLSELENDRLRRRGYMHAIYDKLFGFEKRIAGPTFGYQI